LHWTLAPTPRKTSSPNWLKSVSFAHSGKFMTGAKKDGNHKLMSPANLKTMPVLFSARKCVPIVSILRHLVNLLAPITRWGRLSLLCTVSGWLAMAAVTTRAGDLDFSDPANVAPPPAKAIGFPNRGADFDALPGFKSPPPGYGEVPFYWWVGDPLTKERLSWELDQLAQVDGVMGLQINYAHSDRGGLIYGLTYPNDPPLFSPQWWELTGWFMGEAKKRGMAISLSDYTLGIGQGWRVDEVLRENPSLHGSLLKADQKGAEGGQDFRWPLPPGMLSVTGYRLNGEQIADDGVDLRDFVKNGLLAWRVPEGHWRVIAVWAERVVPSLDPMNPGSGDAYVRKFFGQFTDHFPKEGGTGLNWFFSDELEFRIQGNLWNAQFADEFRRRKGYDIVPELAALFQDIGPRTPKVRLDYSDVKVSLTEEGFFKPVFDWHQQRGMIYGCDHGGRGRNIVEFGDYFRTQRWNQGPGCDQPVLSRDVIKNKVASSIAHLYQRPRVWLEGYHSSGWSTGTEQLTDATFANFIQGQNLLTLHGLYYSTHGGWWEWAPPCNHFRMPYWPHMKEFFACSKRLSFLLSQGYHRCDVAILYPVAAVEAGMGGDQAVGAAFGLGEHLYRQGIDFDFMDFESLARAKVEDKELRVSGERYRVLVLPAMRAVRWSTIEKAAEFARSGGLVIALNALPEASDRLGRNDPELDGLNAQITRRAERPEQVQTMIEKAFTRDFDCPMTAAQDTKPAVMHRRIGTRDVYAVYGAPEHAEAAFRTTGKVELWDPWSGTTRPLQVMAQSADLTRLHMPLSVKEVQLVVFSPGKAEFEPAGVVSNAPASIVALDDPWEFELKPTMDNRFGDFRWPPVPVVIGAEARQFRYSDEIAANPGWQNPSYDDSKWSKVTAAVGPKMWKLGPLPDATDSAALDARLADLAQIDPSAPVEVNGKQYFWQPYSFSWRWGIENDPGHQGYHGLKEEMHPDFIGLGRLQTQATSTSYEKEEGGSRYYLWTSVSAPVDLRANTSVGGMKPAAMWLNRKLVNGSLKSLPLSKGSNPLLLRYNSAGRGFCVFSTGTVQDPKPVTVGIMKMCWFDMPGLLPFDTRPQEANPAGWYRFTSPPGLREMTFVAHGKVQAWADGREMTVSDIKKREGGAHEYKAVVQNPVADAVIAALRIEQERGVYAGEALPEPVALNCGQGEIKLGNWAQQGVLETYSGGAWYRKQLTLTSEQTRRRVTLDLGNLSSSAEVRVNGKPAGIRIAPPWRFDITKLVKPGKNRIEILVLSTLNGHYATIPTRYRGTTVSGLIGPVKMEIK
jgi:hypothetical protein